MGRRLSCHRQVLQKDLGKNGPGLVPGDNLRGRQAAGLLGNGLCSCVVQPFRGNRTPPYRAAYHNGRLTWEGGGPGLGDASSCQLPSPTFSLFGSTSFCLFFPGCSCPCGLPSFYTGKKNMAAARAGTGIMEGSRGTKSGKDGKSSSSRKHHQKKGFKASSSGQSMRGDVDPPYQRNLLEDTMATEQGRKSFRLVFRP